MTRPAKIWIAPGERDGYRQWLVTSGHDGEQGYVAESIVNKLVEALDLATNALATAIRTNKTGWYEDLAFKQCRAALSEYATAVKDAK